ncbi:Oligosaccharyl transferase STT3 subunit [Methanothermus fervidus DSM 2088]|uniref:dolichyl-phosphooligosaccharide-protein glycotransferase n=1 Tax=Methanothermus fervidus (strain ATCC 43054 / DSM 2088 / JCM 10308 / V24 S) TaxID=523846 RepID=E3GXE8_METFV|nr:STT3 domain-containing protein [Methanothermus fervidus]ADP76980.1 Oligosaccharyl transferase STT3 subunit [Methanothermus fervidus DSM 2088]
MKKKMLNTIKQIAIIAILFSLAFYIRSEAVNIGGVPPDQKNFYKDPSTGLPYFSEIDSYYNLRLTTNFLTKGMLGDTKVNGKDWDLHSYYPPGRPVDYPPMIVYVTSFLYKFVNIFKKVSLPVVAFWTGAFIGSLVVIPAYLFVRKITNDYGGITAALLVAFAPVYFAHTFAGLFRTAMFNVLFPILIMWFFAESIVAKTFKRRVIFAVATAISIILFSLSWVGYVFYLAVIFVVALVYFGLRYFIERGKVEYVSKLDWIKGQRELLALLIVAIICGGILTIGGGPSAIPNALSQLVGAVQMQALTQTSSYPNVYISVAELQVPPFVMPIPGKPGSVFLPNQMSAVGQIGGLGVFLLGVAGIIALLWKAGSIYRSEFSLTKDFLKTTPKIRAGKTSKFKKRKRRISEEVSRDIQIEHLFYAVLFTIWSIMAGYAVTKGIRFAEPFSIPMSLSAGIFVGFAADFVKKHVRAELTALTLAFICGILAASPFAPTVQMKFLAGIISAILVYIVRKHSLRSVIIALLIVGVAATPSIYGAQQFASQIVPSSNTGMYNATKWIKDHTTPGTVIMSWWDFGHFFTYEADRPVTFDGGSQNTPRAYWIGKALLTNNETLSAGILRMLASSGDKAYLTLDNYTHDTAKTVEILDKTLGVPKSEARNIMINEYKLTPQQADTILQYTHPDKKRPFVLVCSSDMIPKAAWWSYFGSWNFETKNGTHYFYHISQQVSPPQKEKDKTVIYTINEVMQNQMICTKIEKKANEINATILMGTKGNLNEVKPHKLVIIEGNRVVKNEIVDKDSNYGLVVIGQGGSYVTIVMDKQLEDSVFTKLFILGGFNQTTFKYLHSEPGVSIWTAQ